MATPDTDDIRGQLDQLPPTLRFLVGTLIAAVIAIPAIVALIAFIIFVLVAGALTFMLGAFVRSQKRRRRRAVQREMRRADEEESYP